MSAGPRWVPRRVAHRIARTRSALKRRSDGLRRDRARPCPPLVELKRAYGRGGRAPEVLYLGDSISQFVSWEDWSKKPLTELVARRLAPLRTLALTETAYHAGVYRAVLDVLAVMPTRPRGIVFPVNLRSFSPQWKANPSFQFAEVIAAMEAYAADPTSAVGVVPPFPRRIPYTRMALDPTAWQRYLDTVVSYPGSEMDRVGQFVDEIFGDHIDATDPLHRLRTIFTFHYLFELRPGDERLGAARNVCERAKELGCEVVAYVPPLDWQGGNELLGDQFEQEIACKVETVRSALEPFDVHDWSRLLPSEAFFHRFEATEHLNEHGRARVADEIAQAVTSVVLGGEDGP